MSLRRAAPLLAACLALAVAPPAGAAGTDLHGDRLPPGAVARLGSLRWCHLFPDSRGAHAVVFSPDGKVLASLGDGGAILWDVATGRKLHSIPHPSPGAAAHFSRDGKALMIADPDDAVRYWDVRTGEFLREHEGTPAVNSEGLEAFFSADGKTLLVIGRGGDVHLTDVATGRRTFRRAADAGAACCAALSPGGKLVVLVRDGRALLFDAATGKEIRRLQGPGAPGPLREDGSGRFTFSPDGRLLAAAGPDCLRLWQAGTGKLLRRLPGAAGRPVFSPDGKLIASAGGRAIRLHDPATGKELRRLEASNESVRDLAFSPDGKTLAAAEGDRIGLWDVATGRRRPEPPGHRGTVYDVAVSPDGRCVLSAGTGDPTLVLWDAATGKPRHVLGDPDPTIASLAFSPDGRIAAAGHGRTGKGGVARIRLWDVHTGREVGRIDTPHRAVTSLAFSPDGKHLASAGPDDPVRLWDVASRKELRSFPAARGQQDRGAESPRTVAFSPDGKTLAVARSGVLELWATAAGKRLRRVGLGKAEMRFVAFSPDGKSVLVMADDGAAFVHDVATGREVSASQMSAFWGVPAALASDRMTVATRGLRVDVHQAATGIQVWDRVTGEAVLELRGHEGEVASLAFSPDGKTLVSGGADGTALVWDTSTLPRARLEMLWLLLAARKVDADRAVQSLAETPGQAVPFLAAHVRSAVRAEARVTSLLAALDDDSFAARQKAEAELTKMGRAVEGSLRRVLEGKPSLEVRRRVERILAAVTEAGAFSEADAALRAIDVLERAGTPEARRLLDELSRGAPQGWLTRKARAALRRLPKPPAGRR